LVRVQVGQRGCFRGVKVARFVVSVNR
jgi:hypothetical protein